MIDELLDDSDLDRDLSDEESAMARLFGLTADEWKMYRRHQPDVAGFERRRKEAAEHEKLRTAVRDALDEVDDA